LLQVGYQPHSGIGAPTAIGLGGGRTAVGWESGHVTIFDTSGNIEAAPAFVWPAEVAEPTPVQLLRFAGDGVLAVGWSGERGWAVRTFEAGGGWRLRGRGLGDASGRLLAVGLSAAGEAMAAAGDDAAVKLLPAGVSVAVSGGGVAAAFSGDGRRAAVVSRNGGLECWELAPPRRISQSPGGDWAGCLMLNASGDIVIAGLTGNRVRMVQFSDGQTVGESDGTGCPLAETAQRAVVVTASERAGCLEVQAPGKLSRGALIAARPPVSFSADGAAVAMGSWRGGVDVWETSALLEVLEYRGTSLNVPVAPGLWWRRLEPRGIAGAAALCAPAAGQGVRHLHQLAVQSVAVDDSGTRMATLTETGSLEVRSLPAAKPLMHLDLPVAGGRFGTVKFLRGGLDVALVPPRPVDLLGATVGVSVDAQDALIYQVDGAKLLSRLSGHDKAIGDVAASPDGSRLATAGADETVRVFDIQTATPPRVLTGHASGAFRSVSWSPDGARLIAQAGLAERSYVWRPASDEPPLALLHPGILRGASYFLDARRVLLVGRDAVSVATLPDASNPSAHAAGAMFWERRDAHDAVTTGPVESAPVVAAPPGLAFISSALSDDRLTLALGLSDGRVRVISRLATPAAAARDLALAPDLAEALALSRDGRWLITGGARAVVFDLTGQAHR